MRRFGRSVVLLGLVLVGLWAAPAAGQRYTATLTVREGSASRLLRFGIDPSATNGLDAALGEDEVGPFPGAGVFEARFVSICDSVDLGHGTLRDYRPAATPLVFAERMHRVRIQPAAGGPVTLEWDVPGLVPGLFAEAWGQVETVDGAVVVPMRGRGSHRIDDASVLAVPLSIRLSFRTLADARAEEVVAGMGLSVWPMPARSVATVAYTVVVPGEVRVSVHDALGRRVAVVRQGVVGPGEHRVAVDVAALAAGVYGVCLDGSGSVRCRPFVVAH